MAAETAAFAAEQNEKPAPQRKLPQHSLILKMAEKYGVDADKLLKTLKDTAFRATDKSGDPIEVTNEQMFALLVVADQYNLNPFTRELYAFPAKGGGIVPIVSIDGWVRIVNERPEFNGVEFEYGYAKDGGALIWIEAHMYRRDREHPIKVRELMGECLRNTDPWKTTPSRMLRHRAYIQCARYAFGFAGIYDPDEAAAIIAGEFARVPEADPDTIAKLNAELNKGNTPAAAIAAPEQDRTIPAPNVAAPRQSLVKQVRNGAKGEVIAAEFEAERDSASPAFVRALIDKADSIEKLDEALDLIRFVLDERQRAELDVEERVKRNKIKGDAK